MSEVSTRLTPTNTQAAQPQQRPWWERVQRPQTTAPPAIVQQPAAAPAPRQRYAAPPAPQQQQPAAPAAGQPIETSRLSRDTLLLNPVMAVRGDTYDPAEHPNDRLTRPALYTEPERGLPEKERKQLANERKNPRPREAVRPFDQRAGLLSNAYEMSQEDYDALTDQQKAVVQFNTGLIESARADDVAGNTDATKAFLSQLGIETRSESELDEFLQLDRLVGEKILEKLADPDALRSAADTMRWARGDAPAAGDARHISNALSVGELASPVVAQQLAATGQPLLRGTQGQPGYGSSQHDLAIQQAYMNMVDSRYDLTAEDVLAGIENINASSGTSITADEVWTFLARQLEAAEFNKRDGKPGKLSAPEFDPVTGEAIVPLDVAEIRRRYGL